MNPGSLLVLCIIIGIVAWSVRSLVRDRRSGKACSCGLPAGACGMCAKEAGESCSCHKN